MKKIVLIGAGRFGRRHLEALSKIDFGANIDVVDPSSDSLAAARIHFAAMPTNTEIGEVRFHTSLSGLSGTVDIAIVATSADVRIDVVHALLSVCTVNALILEKVVFQRPTDFETISEVLKRKSVNAWVNHPRRLFPFYERLKIGLSGARKVTYSVRGGAWGLGSNSLHFLDNLAYLTGESNIEIIGDGLDDEIIESKRASFIELTGSLCGRIGTHPFYLFCHEVQSPVVLDICSDNLRVIIDEASGWYRMASRENGWEWKTETEKIVHFQSELTHRVVKDILDSGRCELPTYQQAAVLHIPFLRCLTAHLEKIGHNSAGRCPIT
jgi:hypothetical protein